MPPTIQPTELRQLQAMGGAGVSVAELTRAILAQTGRGVPAGSVLSYGLVSSTGAVLFASGDFTVGHPETGHYLVNWDTARASGNYVLLPVAISETAKRVARVRKQSAASCEVSTWPTEGAGSSEDTEFAFLAISEPS
jgi:hypothetical protein